MLSVEDFPGRQFLSPLQQVFADEYDRRNVSEFRTGRRRRKLLSVGMLPAHIVAQNRATAPVANINCNFVRADAVAVVTLSDHEAPLRKGPLRIESRGLISTPRLDDGGSVVIGGNKLYCRLRCDTTRAPLFKGQSATVVQLKGSESEPVTVPATIAGNLVLVRTGKWLDLCIGDTAPSANTRRILARIDIEEVLGDAPNIVFEFDLQELPPSGGIVPLGRVAVGQGLFTAYGTTRYQKAVFDSNNQPKLEWPNSRTLSANKTEVLSLFNAMIKLQNDVALDSKNVGTVSPSTWLFKTYVAFERIDGIYSDGEVEEPVIIDPDNLTTLPGFAISQALKADLLVGVGPTGSFGIRSAHTGTIVSVLSVANNPLKQIMFSSGEGQFVPATAQLRKVSSNDCLDLVGQEVSAGEIIGDWVPRVKYANWAQLAAALEHNLNWVVEEFMRNAAVKTGEHGWGGSETLHDVRYVASVLDFAASSVVTKTLKTATKTEHFEVNEVRFVFDMRNALPFYVSELGGYVFPPIRYDDWNDMYPVVDGVQFDLSDPFAKREEDEPVEVTELTESSQIS